MSTIFIELGEIDEAINSLHSLLIDCRKMNLVDLESDVLLSLAKAHFSLGGSNQENESQVRAYVSEALSLANRYGYRLKQADIYNFMAEWKYQEGKYPEACENAKIAKELAWCDGPDHYSYKIALSKAERLLQNDFCK